MLLSGKGGTCHDEHTFLLGLLALGLIDTTDCLQWEGVAQGAPGAVASLVIIVSLRRIKEVGIGRVHPPAIYTLIKEILQVLPVDIASHR